MDAALDESYTPLSISIRQGSHHHDLTVRAACPERKHLVFVCNVVVLVCACVHVCACVRACVCVCSCVCMRVVADSFSAKEEKDGMFSKAF